MGIFFNDIKPHISEQEFIKVKSRLINQGFSQTEIHHIEMIFRGDMYEEYDRERGIDEKEIDRGITWMRTNTTKHLVSSSHIDILEQTMKEYLGSKTY